jgi:hypothetical protein
MGSARLGSTLSGNSSQHASAEPGPLRELLARTHQKHRACCAFRRGPAHIRESASRNQRNSTGDAVLVSGEPSVSKRSQFCSRHLRGHIAKEVASWAGAGTLGSGHAWGSRLPVGAGPDIRESTKHKEHIMGKGSRSRLAARLSLSNPLQPNPSLQRTRFARR